MRNLRFRMLVLYLFLGTVIGSLLGEMIGWLMPPGVVKEFFLRHIEIGIDPTMLNLHVFTLTLGFSVTVNIAGIFGLLIAVYMLRWYR